MRRRAALFWIAVWAFCIVGALFTVPWLFRDGGRAAVAACAAWSGSIPITFVLLVRFGEKRFQEVKSHARFGLALLGVLVLMLSVAPLATASLYGPEAATGAMYLSFLIGFGSLFASALIVNWRLEREAAERERFFARFKQGPIGYWRGIRLGIGRVEEGCQIVFNSEGSGRFRLWETADGESGADSVQFRWRPTGKNQIEVSLSDDDGSKQLEFGIAFYGGMSAKLLLSIREAQTPEQAPYDIGFAEFDRIHWPRWVAFDYLGEPASGVATIQP